MKIHAIQTGIVHVKSDFVRGSAAAGSTLNFLVRLFTDKRTVDLPIYAWLIEHEEGLFLVDTGDLSDTGLSFVTRSTFTIQREEEIDARLKALGVALRDLSRVVLTHIHGDHANGLRRLGHVPTFISAEENAVYRSQFGGAFIRWTARLPKDFDPKPVEAFNVPFGSFPRHYPLTKAGDVVGVPTPGHTPGHMSVIAVQDGISYFLAGDVSYDQAALLSQTLEGPSVDLSSHPQSLRRALDYARSTPTVYLPAHDPESGRRCAQRDVVPGEA